MQIKDAGFWTRGTAAMPPSPHINIETLIQDLTQYWGPRGLAGSDLGACNTWTVPASRVR